MVLTRELKLRISDLKIQSMLFDMDIDWETLTLIPKIERYIKPIWLQEYEAKRQFSDLDELIDMDQE